MDDNCSLSLRYCRDRRDGISTRYLIAVYRDVVSRSGRCRSQAKFAVEVNKGLCAIAAETG